MSSGVAAVHGENCRQLYYLGCSESAAHGEGRIGFAGGDKSVERRSSDERLIDLVENAQLEGHLPIRADDKLSKQVIVNVSKHGLKIVDLSNGNVLDRVALLSIIQCVSFDDGFNHTNVVFLVQKPLSALMQCYLFQARNANDADYICKQLKSVFNAVVRQV
ncbi:unnamed protein product [Anisakis simplex]|uniref:PID domain-containing protein n=1 Tax=Anisakis simplex TaxID=6269 RepID=A0A0M3JZ92_ANISI|nr:unnamed protein product [Anisakis simplex]